MMAPYPGYIYLYHGSICYGGISVYDDTTPLRYHVAGQHITRIGYDSIYIKINIISINIISV